MCEEAKIMNKVMTDVMLLCCYSVYDHQRIEDVVLDGKHTVVVEPGTPITENQVS